MSKIFRVKITDSVCYYKDVEAENAEQACEQVEKMIKDNPAITFSEDYEAYEGYKVNGANIIKKENSDYGE